MIVRVKTQCWSHVLPTDLADQWPTPGGMLIFDTETSGLHPDDGHYVSTVSAAWLEYSSDDGNSPDEQVTIHYGAWPFRQGNYGDRAETLLDLLEDDPNLSPVQWVALLGWMARAVALVGHNVKFDLMMMQAGPWPDERGRSEAGARLAAMPFFDTMVMAREVWPDQPAALKVIATRLWGANQADEQAALKPYLGPKTNPRFDQVPWDVMRPYAEQDAVLCARLWLHLCGLTAEGQGMLGGGWRREHRITRALLDMELAGIPYDAERSREVALVLADRAQTVRAKLPFTTTPTAKQYYFSDRKVMGADGVRRKGLGLDPYALTETGQPQLTAETLGRMAKDGVEFATELIEVNRAENAISMWYEPYADGVGPDGRLRTVFRQVASGSGGEGGTASGRFSVERLNLQAIPHDYRMSGPGSRLLEGLPTPRELIGSAAARLSGWRLSELDLAQAELRVAALWAGCESMVSAIVEGRDAHGETCTQLFDLQPGDDGWDKMRGIAKRANFSLIFGAGWSTFQQSIAQAAQVYLSDAEAKRIVYGWNDLYPEFRAAIDWHSEYAEARGYVELANDRRRWFKPGEQTHKAFNQRVQASLAELGKEWILATQRVLAGTDVHERAARDLGARAGLLLVIHDSQVILLPEDEADAIIERVVAGALQAWDEMFSPMPGGVDAKRWG